MEDINDVLKDNAKEYYKNALGAEKKGEFNTAVTLFFKTISSLADLYILLKESRMPKSHTDRFRILEDKYPEIYKLIDKNFPFYQDSYRAKLNKEICEVLREDAEKLFRELKIQF